MAAHVTIPSGLIAELEIEGSVLTIMKASEHNLDWTWKVRYTRGLMSCPGQPGSVTEVYGADLRQAVTRLAKVLTKGPHDD